MFPLAAGLKEKAAFLRMSSFKYKKTPKINYLTADDTQNSYSASYVTSRERASTRLKFLLYLIFFVFKLPRKVCEGYNCGSRSDSFYVLLFM